MTVSDYEWRETIARIVKLEREATALRATVNKWRANGLKDLDVGHGFQDFGGGAVRLDNEGVQVKASSEAGAIWFDDAFGEQDINSDHIAVAGWDTGSVRELDLSIRDNSGDETSKLALTSTTAADGTAGAVLRARADTLSSVLTAGLDLQANGASNFATASVTGLFAFQGSESETIAAGVITISQATRVIVDTEAAAASDDLDTINFAGTLFGGEVIILQAANEARTVVVKNGTGNIDTGGAGGDFSLTSQDDIVGLMYDDRNTRWLLLWSQNNTT